MRNKDISLPKIIMDLDNYNKLPDFNIKRERLLVFQILYQALTNHIR